MAAGQSPIAMMLRNAIMSKLGQGGGGVPGGMPGGQPGGNPDAISSAVSSQYSELQGADPGKVLADLNRIKAELAAMFPNAVLRVADAGKGISQAVTGINSAVKAFEKAQETLRAANPGIGLTAANPEMSGSPMTGGMPNAFAG